MRTVIEGCETGLVGMHSLKSSRPLWPKCHAIDKQANDRARVGARLRNCMAMPAHAVASPANKPARHKEMKRSGLAMSAHAFLLYSRLAQAGRKESTDFRLSQACLPYAMPSSISFFDRHLSDAYTAEDESMETQFWRCHLVTLPARIASRCRSSVNSWLFSNHRIGPGRCQYYD
jgi:hypothetical protein